MSQKTVIFEVQDGYPVVKMFGEATVDHKATWAKIQGQVLALDERARINGVTAKIAAQAQLGRDAWMLADAAEKNKDAESAASYLAQYNAAIAAIPVLEKELVPLNEAFEAARAALFEANAAYCTPGPGESAISEADHAALAAKFEALGDHQALTLTGEVIEDWRGAEYWTKGKIWEKGVVAVLGTGLPPGAVLEEKLTEGQKAEISAQVETARIAGLTATQNATEKASRLHSAAQEAANKASLAAVTGDEFDAKAWYQTRKAEIEALYA